MSNLYVSYDDLLSVMSREKLDTLPTIDLSVIDDMIEEKRDKPYWDVGDISILKELKQKLLSPKK